MSTSSARTSAGTSAAAHSASPPSGFRLERSILRRWPKAAAVTVSRAARVRSSGRSGAGASADHGRVDLGRRGEGAGGQRPSRARPRRAPGRARTGGRRRPRPAGRRCAGRPPSGTSGSCRAGRQGPVSHLIEQRRADVVGQVGDDHGRRPAGVGEQARLVGRQRVGLDHGQPRPRRPRASSASMRQEARVLLDGDDAGRRLPAGRGSGRRGPGRPRSPPRRRAGRPGGRSCGVTLRSSRKCWPKRLFGRQPVRGERLAQRRQVVEGSRCAPSSARGDIARPGGSPRSGCRAVRALGLRCRSRCRGRARCARSAGRASRSPRPRSPAS